MLGFMDHFAPDCCLLLYWKNHWHLGQDFHFLSWGISVSYQRPICIRPEGPSGSSPAGCPLGAGGLETRARVRPEGPAPLRIARRWMASWRDRTGSRTDRRRSQADQKRLIIVVIYIIIAIRLLKVENAEPPAKSRVKPANGICDNAPMEPSSLGDYRASPRPLGTGKV